QASIRIDSAEVVKGKDMVRGLQDPPSARELGIKMLEKTAMEAIGIEKAAMPQPAVVGGDAVHGVEAQALEHVCDDVRALLGCIDCDRMEGVELGGDHAKQGELQTDPPLAQRCSDTPLLRG